MQNRLNDINNFVDDYLKSDYIDVLIKKYKSDLVDYIYIDNLDKFSVLPLRGSLKYINKYDHKLRNGGLLIKIYKKQDKWYGIIKKFDKKYYISFDSNYIFYLENKNDMLRTWAECFINDVDKGKYDIN